MNRIIAGVLGVVVGYVVGALAGYNAGWKDAVFASRRAKIRQLEQDVDSWEGR